IIGVSTTSCVSPRINRIIFDFDIHRILKLAQFCENLDEYDKTSSTSSNPGHPDSDKMQLLKI
ncbi:MAG: hypothetical protein RLZZ86_3150, partial [Cyanobacteriota bacterium]